MKPIYNGRLIFDHQPKTAGSSIHAWMTEALGTHQVTPIVIGDHKDLIRKFGGVYSAISGHILFHNGEGLDPRYQYITLFREPIARVRSWLNFIIYNHNEGEIIVERDAVKRFIASDGAECDLSIRHAISDLYVNHFCRVYGTGLESDEVKVENAFAVLQEYHVVGLYNHLGLFLRSVANLVRVPLNDDIPMVNVTRQPDEARQISAQLHASLVDLNRLDIALFERVEAWLATLPEPVYLLQQDCVITTIRRPPQPQLQTTELQVLNFQLKPGLDVVKNDLLTLEIDVHVLTDLADMEISVNIYDPYHAWIFGHRENLSTLRAGTQRMTIALTADLPSTRYSFGIEFNQLHAHGKTQKLWYEPPLRFEVKSFTNQLTTGYTRLPIQIGIQPIEAIHQHLSAISRPGHIHILTTDTSVPPQLHAQIEIEIHHQGDEDWHLHDPRWPVHLSYHWLSDDMQLHHFEGQRTALPVAIINPGQVIRTQMNIETPSSAGTYHLVATLVQEGVTWFENAGFTLTPVRVEVNG